MLLTLTITWRMYWKHIIGHYHLLSLPIKSTVWIKYTTIYLKIHFRFLQFSFINNSKITHSTKIEKLYKSFLSYIKSVLLSQYYNSTQGLWSFMKRKNWIELNRIECEHIYFVSYQIIQMYGFIMEILFQEG